MDQIIFFFILFPGIPLFFWMLGSGMGIFWGADENEKRQCKEDFFIGLIVIAVMIVGCLIGRALPPISIILNP